MEIEYIILFIVFLMSGYLYQDKVNPWFWDIFVWGLNSLMPLIFVWGIITWIMTYSWIFTEKLCPIYAWYIICTWITFLFIIFIYKKNNPTEYSEKNTNISQTHKIPINIEEVNKKKMEVEEKQKNELIKRRNSLIPENYIKKFLQHAERNYEKTDKYWNKNKDSLEKEVSDYLDMIAKQVWDKHQYSAIEAYSRWRSYPALNEDYRWLISYLKSEFHKYHTERQQKDKDNSINISQMTWIEFERFLANIFKSSGYVIDMTPESWDQWADIIAEKNGRKIIIQAKRYTSSVWNGAVQEVIWAIRYYEWNEWWVITNSTFTNSARELARVNHITLIDGDSLEDIKKLI